MKDEIDQDDVRALKRMMNDKFIGLVARYRENAKNYIEGMRKGVDNADIESVVRNAHALKSPSAMMGMKALGETADHIEMMAKSEGKEALDKIAACMPDIERLFQQAEGFLEEEVLR